MSPASLPERAGRAAVTGSLVLFAVWTLVYQVALFTGLRATPSLVIAVVLGAGALVGLSHLDRDRDRDPLAWPAAGPALAVVAVAVVATVVAVVGHRLIALALGVTAALVALGVSGMRAPAREARRLAREAGAAGGGVRGPGGAAAAPGDSGHDLDDPHDPHDHDHDHDRDRDLDRDRDRDRDDTASGTAGSARWLWVAGWAAGLVSAALAAVLVTPDGDDAYFVNLSTWVAERGYFPLRDTMISADVFPAISGHSPPVHSVEGLIGALAGVLGLEAGTVAYVVVPPVVTLLAVLVLTLVVAEAGIPAAPAALLATVAYLWTAGRTGYGLGGFFAVRIWQGKAMLLSVALPLVFLFGARLVRSRSARSHLLFGASLVAAVGVSNTAVFLVPVLVAGLVLGAVALAEWRGVLRLALWTLYPVAMAALSIVLAPAGPTRQQLLSAGFDVGPVTETIDPVRTVPGIAGMLVVTALAIGIGSLGIGNRAMRLGAAGTIVTGGLALLPPVREVLRDLGLWSVVWRMWWAIPIALLLAGCVGAAAHWARGRRLAPLAVGAAVAVIALVPLVGGRWVGSPKNDARWAVPYAWKLPSGAFSQAELVESVSAPGDTVLVPSSTARGLAALTVDLRLVSARPFYLPNYSATPEAKAGERLVLQQFVDRTTPDDPSDVTAALDELDVRTVCLKNHRDGGIRLLEDDGFTQVAKDHGITCLQR